MATSTFPEMNRELLGSLVRRVTIVGFALSAMLCSLPSVSAEKLDELSLDRWAKLREVERYQLKIAEKYYLDKNYKVAAAEYEKFLTLYEQSEAAPYSQLKWSLCQIQLRKLNTAVKEGFQSVIDYWPESADAVAAAYYIGNTYKDLGDIKSAKKAYHEVLKKHPKHLVAVYAVNDLIDISRIEDDEKSRVELWKRLTFDIERTKESKRVCQEASQQLAVYFFQQGELGDAVKALETTYTEEQLPYYVVYFARQPLQQLAADEKTKPKSIRLCDEGIAWMRGKVPTNLKDEEQQKRARACWNYMADLLIASQQHDRVEQHYKDVLKKYGSHDDTLGLFAAWYKSQKKYDLARQQYALFENKVEGQNQIAISYRDEQNYDAAIAAFQKNASLDPDKQAYWTSMAAHTLHHYSKKYTEAIAIYQELLKSDPENTNNWLWQIATAYRDAGKFKQAIAFYRQCENFPSNYQEMAQCHRRLKEYKEAIILYNQIIGGAPKSAPWALLQIGYTNEQAGKKELAIKSFQQVCKQYPKDSHASVAHAYLQDKYKISVTLGGATDE